MTATCLNTNGIDAVLRICCCASGSMVLHGRNTTALSLTVSTALKVTRSWRSVKGRRTGPSVGRAGTVPLTTRRSSHRVRTVAESPVSCGVEDMEATAIRHRYGRPGLKCGRRYRQGALGACLRTRHRDDTAALFVACAGCPDG